MTKSDFTNPVANEVIIPSALSPKHEELCRRLDEFYSLQNFTVKPSTMFRGAIFAMKRELRNNPDWIAQASNSLRDIYYPFRNKKNSKKAFKEFGSVRDNSNNEQELFRVYLDLTELTHHGNSGNRVGFHKFTGNQFETLLNRFADLMFDVLARQIDLHTEVDNVIAQLSTELGTTNPPVNEPK